MNELRHVPDRYLLELADRAIILWQRATGIPKWQVEVNLWCALALSSVFPALRILGHGWALALCASLMLLTSVLGIVAWNVLSLWMRWPQDTADRLDTPIACPIRNTIIGLGFRVIMVFNALAQFRKPVHPDDMVRAVLYLLIAYVSHTHTWPNSGPTLRDRWRNAQAKLKLRLIPVRA